MIQKLIKFKNQLFLFIIIMLLSVLAVILIISTVNSKAIGQDIGRSTGEIVGKITGSTKALTNANSFFQEGKENALENPNVQIENIKNNCVGKKELIVLEAEITIDDVIEMPNKKYKELILWENCKVEFAVDFNKTDVSYDNPTNTLYVTLPKPKATLYMGESKTIYKTHDFNFKNSDEGAKAYENSRNKIKQEAEKNISNYETLLETAKLSAKSEVYGIIESVSFAENVVINFEGEN